MTIRVNRFSVNTGGQIYAAGDFIPGLSEAEERRLVDGGYCEYAETELLAAESAGSPAGEQSEAWKNAISLEAFGALQAPQQKELLEGLDIVPAGKEPDRIVQYQEWLEAGGNAAANGDDGPNTGIVI